MKFLTPVLLAALILVGCEKIEGQLNITKEFKLTNSKGDSHLLSVGTYSADINPNSSKKITLRLNNDSDEKFVFTHNGNIPDNGTFQISSRESGQPVNLLGTINTVVSNSEQRQRNESCSYTRPVQVCYPTPRGTVCSIQYQTVYGYRWVRYYDRYTSKNVMMNVMAADESTSSADFHGNINFTETIILGDSGCR